MLIALAISMPFILTTMQSKLAIRSAGKIKAIGVGVYWDEECITPITTIDWGIVEPGSTTNKTIFVKNLGNTEITLSKQETNWNPTSAVNFITLVWNYEGQAISPAKSFELILTLRVSPNIADIAVFSFDIEITGTG